MEEEIKVNKPEFTAVDTTFETQTEFNQNFINDLIKLKTTMLVAPTSTPKKFIDQIQFVYTGGSYYLYVFINGSWKSTSLT